MTPVTLPREVVQRALRRAYSLGQTYWQQADSESYSQNRKSNATSATFNQLVTDTIAALDAPTQGVASDPDKVICPACVHEFMAIPENVQARLASAAPANQPCQMCKHADFDNNTAKYCQSEVCLGCTDFDKYTALPPIVLTKVTK